MDEEKQKNFLCLKNVFILLIVIFYYLFCSVLSVVEAFLLFFRTLLRLRRFLLFLLRLGIQGRFCGLTACLTAFGRRKWMAILGKYIAEAVG